ncbi:MAG: GNAT family N-acetyltransferase [Haloplanus sp.]
MNAREDEDGNRETAEDTDPGGTGGGGVRFRRFDPERDDPEALRALHERALRDAGTNPDDVPGTEDLERIPETYLDGGEFIVGVVDDGVVKDGVIDDGTDADGAGDDEAGDDRVVAMGGFRPASDLPPGGHEGFDPGAAAPADAVELFRIAVAPEAQGRGLGAELLAELERRAAERGFSWVVLTTAARQRAGLELYRSRGYAEVGRLQQGAYELVRFEKSL